MRRRRHGRRLRVACRARRWSGRGLRRRPRGRSGRVSRGRRRCRLGRGRRGQARRRPGGRCAGRGAWVCRRGDHGHHVRRRRWGHRRRRLESVPCADRGEPAQRPGRRDKQHHRHPRRQPDRCRPAAGPGHPPRVAQRHHHGRRAPSARCRGQGSERRGRRLGLQRGHDRRGETRPRRDVSRSGEPLEIRRRRPHPSGVRRCHGIDLPGVVGAAASRHRIDPTSSRRPRSRSRPRWRWVLTVPCGREHTSAISGTVSPAK